MPRTIATITHEQRDAIHGFVVENLSRLTDLPLAIKREDFTTARRLAREFGQDFRLLDDLGWGTDARLEVALTMPSEELVEMLRRLYEDADGALAGSPTEREAREAEETCWRRDKLVLDTASGLLIELGSKGESA